MELTKKRKAILEIIQDDGWFEYFPEHDGGAIVELYNRLSERDRSRWNNSYFELEDWLVNQAELVYPLLWEFSYDGENDVYSGLNITSAGRQLLGVEDVLEVGEYQIIRDGNSKLIRLTPYL